MDLNLTQLPASKGSFIERRQIDLTAGHTKSVNIYGRVFFCNAAIAAFEMNFNDGEFFPIIGRGVEWALVGDDRYSRLQFRSAVTNSIEFYAGNFAYHENVVIPVSKVAQTLIKAPPVTVLATGVSIPLVGVGPSPYGYRKHLIVTNLDPDVDLDLLDADDHIIATIFARQANVFETSADVKLKNNTAGTIAYRVMEIFYAA